MYSKCMIRGVAKCGLNWDVACMFDLNIVPAAIRKKLEPVVTLCGMRPDARYRFHTLTTSLNLSLSDLYPKHRCRSKCIHSTFSDFLLR